MNLKFDLKQMLEEIKKDEAVAKANAPLISQDEIQKLLLERDRPKEKESHDSD